MVNKLLKEWSETGLRLPVAYDAKTGVGSITLLLVWVSNLLCILSLICLHFRYDALVATTVTLVYAVISSVLYLIRKLQSFKLDVDDQSIELEGEKVSDD